MKTGKDLLKKIVEIGFINSNMLKKYDIITVGRLDTLLEYKKKGKITNQTWINKEHRSYINENGKMVEQKSTKLCLFTIGGQLYAIETFAIKSGNTYRPATMKEVEKYLEL